MVKKRQMAVMDKKHREWEAEIIKQSEEATLEVQKTFTVKQVLGDNEKHLVEFNCWKDAEKLFGFEKDKKQTLKPVPQKIHKA